jgi:hypothetical protein
MPITLNQPELAGEAGHNNLFGGNILAPRGDLTGEGSYAEAIADMGVMGLRYPGGSLTEQYFDLENPNATTAIDNETGEQVDFIPLNDFMNYAGDMEHGVTIVVPTRDQLSSQTDVNGDRLPAVEEDVLRDFVHDVVTGVYGDAPVQAFELGNEYWGSGRMNAVEYGRLSAEMAVIIDDELRLVSEIYGTDVSQTQVVVQMGHNYAYSSLSEEYEGWSSEDVIDDLNDKYPHADITYDNIRGNGVVNWTEVNNELVQMSFDTPAEQGAMDGIVAHIYSRGADNEGSKFYDLDNIDRTWLQDEGFEDLDIYVTEWNQKSTSGLDREDDYGLYQAHEILNITEAFMANGVDVAHVWPLIQNTSNPLATGMNYTEMSAPGEMFAMMSEHIPGKTMLDFTPGADRETQMEADNFHLHGFAGDDQLVFYIASTSETSQSSELDLSGLIQTHGGMDIQILGVADGENPGHNWSTAEIEIVDTESAYQDGVLSLTLDRGEIMQVVVRDVVPTESFADTMAAANGEQRDPSDDPDADAPEDPDDEVDEEGGGSDDEAPHEDDNSGSSFDFGDLTWLVALIPILALAGLA